MQIVSVTVKITMMDGCKLILVPQALRAFQKDFQTAVTGNIPMMASVSKEMMEVEVEVRRTRKKLKKLG